MNKRILRHYGIEEKGFFRDDIFKMMAKDIIDSIHHNEMIAIVGKWGIGKTELFNEVKRQLSSDPDTAPIFIRVCHPDKERVRIGTLMNAMLYNQDISQGEHIRQDSEARAIQLIRLVGTIVSSQKKHICIFIENAHMLHTNTIRAIKDLRENDFNGIAPLFSVVLIGQEPLGEKIRRFGEVRCRVSNYELSPSESGWMTYAKRVSYLKTVYDQGINSGKIKQDAIKRVASLTDTPLGMSHLLETTMEKMFRAGKQFIDGDCFEIELKEWANILEVSYRKIASIAGISTTKVANVMNNTDTKNKEKIKATLRKIEQEKTETGKETRIGNMAAAGE